SGEGRGAVFTFTHSTASQQIKSEPDKSIAARGLAHAVLNNKQQEPGIEPAGYNEGKNLNAAEGYRILVVDDDPVNLQVLCNHLTGDQFDVTTAADGMKALEMIKSGKQFDLILLDVMMPRLSGYQVCREIRKTRDQGEMPVIMITARNFISDLVTAFDAGANDYLVRPFDKRELLARVRTMMNLKEARREHEELVIMNEELNIAGRVQQQVLSSREMFASLENFEVDVVYLPQNKTVSGDYYNISIMEDGSTAFTVADVTGHGIQAALFTMQVDIVHKQSLKLYGPDRRMDYLNRVFIRDLQTDSFFTAFLMQILEGRLYYASAGHPDQLLIRGATGEMMSLRGKGRILGFDQDSKYELKQEELQQGDVILLFSDGIYEGISTDGEIFGEERFISLVRELIDEGYCRGSMKELTGVLMERLHRQYEGMTYMDDITLMAIKIR
ncbi:MAG: SpoIIE family protein phosphatase, partial [Spirochaetota bacterium]